MADAALHDGGSLSSGTLQDLSTHSAARSGFLTTHVDGEHVGAPKSTGSCEFAHRGDHRLINLGVHQLAACGSYSWSEEVLGEGIQSQSNAPPHGELRSRGA